MLRGKISRRGGASGPAPLADVVEEAVDRDHPPAALLDRDRRTVDRARGLGDRGHIALDVAASVQAGETVESGIDRGEVAAELPQLGRGATHGRARMRRAQPVEIGEQCWSQPVRNPAPDQPPLERLGGARRPRRRSLGEDAQVVEHRSGRAQRAPEVTGAAARAPVALVERGLEFVQVAGSQHAQFTAGLDQHPGRDQTGRPVRRAGGEPELARRGQKAPQVRVGRARRQLAPERQKRARRQVVIAGPQMTVQHQKHHQLPGPRADAQPDRKRLGRPALRVGPALHEALGRARVARIGPAAGGARCATNASTRSIL
jgi:hypothetical protein